MKRILVRSLLLVLVLGAFFGSLLAQEPDSVLEEAGGLVGQGRGQGVGDVAVRFVSATVGEGDALVLGNVVLGAGGSTVFTASGVSENRMTAHDPCVFWTKNSPIGIYMLGSAGDVVENRVYLARPAHFANVSTVYGDCRTAVFTAVPASERIYYPRDSSVLVRFMAYYPYRDIRKGRYGFPVDLRDQSASSAPITMDVLYANDGVAYAADTNVVSLRFHHAFAALSLEVHAGDGFTSDDLQGLQVMLPNVCGLGSFDLETGSCTVAATRSGIIPYTSDEGDRVYALLFPQTVTENETRPLRITFKLIRGESFVWVVPPMALEADGLYKFHITLTK